MGGGSVATVVDRSWVQADSLETRSVPRRPIAKIAAHAHTRTSRCQVNPKVTALPVEPGHEECIAVARAIQRKYLAPAAADGSFQRKNRSIRNGSSSGGEAPSSTMPATSFPVTGARVIPMRPWPVAT
jgi:hypothetical protein